MKIRELTLSNYRPYREEMTFKFKDQFNVVAGINGRGKTALLEGIAALCSRLLPHVSMARSGYRSVISGEIHGDAKAAELGMRVNCAGIPIEYRMSFNRLDGAIKTTKLPAAVKWEVKRAYGDVTRADDAAPLAVYYTTDRAGYRLPKSLPKMVPRGQAAAYAGALVNRTVNFRDFMARYRSLAAIEDTERIRNPNYLGDGAIRAISRSLEKFLDGFGNLRVEEAPLRLLVDKKNVTLDLTQLSDGERSFLAMVCDLGRRLALANPDADDPLLGSGVVLIDELELHLHPRWQREICEKLRNTFPNIQFIGTTHSPFVIQAVKAGELINLDPEEFGEYADRSIEDIAENVMGVELPQKSQRYYKMIEAATEYYRLLRTRSALPDEIYEAERKLSILSEPFSDDPAFQALLRIERETQASGGGGAAD